VPVRNYGGDVVSLAASVRDISARRQATDRQALIANELTHRLKNTLATVQSIAAQTLRQATSLDGFGAAFDSRLQALAGSHDLLIRAAASDVALADLIAIALSPYGEPDGDRWSASGAGVTLNVGQVLPLGMILHELATNAGKYGALSAPHGRVGVSWKVQFAEAGSRLHLIWAESDGPIVQPPTRKGFGSRLIADCVTGELHGDFTMAFNALGARCDIDIPLLAAGNVS
jgi:two-component sensor histidine kinase